MINSVSLLLFYIKILDDHLWEIISTQSILEEEVQCEITKDNYELIPEYFK